MEDLILQDAGSKSIQAMSSPPSPERENYLSDQLEILSWNKPEEDLFDAQEEKATLVFEVLVFANGVA